MAPADLEERLHQVAEQWVRAHVTREIVDRLLVRVGDARGEQAVGDRLGIHICKGVSIQVMHERFLECLHELSDTPVLGFDGECGLDAVTDRTGQLG